MRDFTLPRSRGDQVDKLLGKHGTPLDRHSLASEDLLGRLPSARQRLAAKHCSWDETLAMMQWVLGGVLNYAPLIGLPAPADAHREDAAFHRLILSGLGVRRTAEHVSLSAPRSSGGLGAPLISELLVAAVASDVLLLLNGVEQAAAVARDTIRQAMDCPPHEVPDHAGLLSNALHFLAGYGLYLSLSTGIGLFPVFWITSIPLSRKPWLALSPRRGLTLQPASLVWGCSPTLSAPPTMPFSSCRIRRRNSLSRRPGRPICLRTPRSPLRPVRAQLLQPSGSRVLISRRNAAFLLCRARCAHPLKTGSLPLGLPPGTLWLIPGPPIFCRGRRSQQATCFTSSHGATFACQARGFGPSNDYWGSASWVSCQFRGRLPARLGWAHSSIHTAELLSLVVALRFRQPGHWHLLAFDRSSLFDILVMVDRGVTQDLLTSPGLPLVCHLRRLLGELADSWKDPPPQPAWRLQQEQAPSLWNVRLPLEGRVRQFSKIAFVRHGVVGVHVRSHQTHSSHPCSAVVQGNEVQDEGCRQARLLPAVPDIFIPSGGPLAWLTLNGPP